ncbi:MAG TPA: hypothetical protein PLM07_19430 [Candidatus Rifleibacterium sp.]|nr:hypothetical protein [Candidatus Rifleibacterium sp.]HPT48060.1 hypothetical protein [Candidatus Rifleibacterium sp.]
MAADRRDSDNRRGSENADGRRAKADRRSSGRRGNDSNSGDEAPSQRRGGSAKKSRSAFSSRFKRFALLLIFIAVVFSAGTVYFYANLDYFTARLGDRVEISVDRAMIDPESLTGKIARARLHFRVKNTLPIGVVFQKLNFNVGISEYNVAKGMQAAPKVSIEAGKDTIVPVACSVDSIMTRRALQKTIERKAGTLLKELLSQARNKTDAFGDDIKGLVKINGSAEFRLKVGGVEIPFSRKLNF